MAVLLRAPCPSRSGPASPPPTAETRAIALSHRRSPATPTMAPLAVIVALLSLSLPVLSAPSLQQVVLGPARAPRRRPLVLWHGLGDSHSSKGMVEVQETLKESFPGLFTHSIYIAESEDDDRRAGFVRLLRPLSLGSPC